MSEKNTKLKLLDRFDQFHEMATEATGLSDFGRDDYHQTLRVLLRDLDKRGQLTELGEQGLVRNIVGLLSGRLMAAEGLKKHPDALNTEIVKPLIITGMPRTGSTVLLRLMSLDPGLQSLPLWLAMMPMPRPARETWEANPVFQQIDQGLKQLDQDAPMFRKIHPIYAEKADECRWAFDQTFYSQTLANGYSLPVYADWIKTADSTSAYEYYKQVLRLIANGDQRRWLLKDPTHLNTFDGLLSVFPDACFVLTHRNITEVVSSSANLIWSFKADRQRGVTKETVGKLTMEMLADCAQKLESARKRLPPEQFFDVHVSETRSDPIGTMKRIYSYFDIPVSAGCQQIWEQEIERDPDQGHGLHRHCLEDFGFSIDSINGSIDSDYLQRLAALEDSLKNTG